MRYFRLVAKNPFKNSHCVESRTRKSCKLFMKEHYAKNHKHVHHIYLQTDSMPRSVLLVLRETDLQECVDPSDSNMEEFRKALPIP